MSEQEKIQLFEDQKIRTAWDTEKEEWYFSVTDVISVLTGQQTARGASNYWAKLKQRLKEEGADELLKGDFDASNLLMGNIFDCLLERPMKLLPPDFPIT